MGWLIWKADIGTGKWGIMLDRCGKNIYYVEKSFVRYFMRHKSSIKIYMAFFLSAALLVTLGAPAVAVQAEPDLGVGVETGESMNQDAEAGTDEGSSPDGEINADAGDSAGAGTLPEGGADADDGASAESGAEADEAASPDVQEVPDTDQETAAWIETARQALKAIASERDIMALIYLSDTYPVRQQPSYDSGNVVTVYSGQQVNILDIYVDIREEGAEVWEYVRLEYRGQEYFGYVPRTFIAVSDTRFLEWEETYGMNPEQGVYSVDGEGKASYSDIDQFPESYRQALVALKEKHPDWTFVKLNTALDWNSVIASQMKGSTSLVYKTLPAWAKNGLQDEGTWYFASEAAVKMYMDPRNFLEEDTIFQFELLTYNEEFHTQEAVHNFLDGTFMNDRDGKKAPGTSSTYTEIFWKVGTDKGREVSPFHLAVRVYQEQGQGTSPLISGTYPGYVGFYNYFNVGASGASNQEVYESGLSYAKSKNWTDAEKSIAGGADVIAANYIKKGQDTLYLQKYNVNPDSSYPINTHQYMQNISAPSSEAKNMKKLYAGANAMDSAFVFKIPVFDNMPEQPCGAPAESTEVVVTLPEGYTDTTLWIDGKAYTGIKKGKNLIAKAEDTKAQTAVMYQYDEKGVPRGMYVWSLRFADGVYTPTPAPELQDLLTYHGFSIRITGKSGIRFKTGISTELREKLTTTGAGGYLLKEYGTLVMNNANRQQYPMIKGGEKVADGLSYGVDGNGNKTDVVYETVDGRYRFTSVLVGLPAAQYKTEYAFRGYIVLEKGGETITLYGPPVARSIYNLAKQLLENGTYTPGSTAYEFLTKLISDADASGN